MFFESINKSSLFWNDLYVISTTSSSSGSTSDGKVKLTTADLNPDYLMNKIDNSIFEIDLSTNLVRIKSDLYASYTHNHTLSDITNFPSLTGNANKVLTVNSTEDGVIWSSVTTTDELVKTDSSDPTAGYLNDKVDNTTITIDTTNHKLKVKENVFAPYSHTHNISDIPQFPSLTGNAGKFVAVNTSENGFEYKDIVVTDELVKINSSDSSAGYLSDKIDNDTIVVDTTNNVIKINDIKFAPALHTHSWLDIDKSGSKLSDINDIPDYTGNAGKFLAVNSTEDGVVWSDIVSTDELVKADSSDTTPGYLSDKVDNTTIEVDITNHVIKVKDGVFTKINDSAINLSDTYSSNKINDISSSYLQIAKSYVVYLSKITDFSEYVIAEPSDSTGGTIETGLVKIDPLNEIIYTIDITKSDSTTPTQVALNIIPSSSKIKLQYSFDNTTFTDYTPDSLITNSSASNTLYVKVINQDSTLPTYVYGVSVVFE